MSETPHHETEPTTSPVPTVAPTTDHATTYEDRPAYVGQPAYVEQPPRARKSHRLYQVAAWVGIAAGSVFIVAVIFFSGFALGAHSGGGHHGGWRHGQEQGMRHDGPPMRPSFIFPGGPGGPFGQGGPGGPFGQGAPGGQGGQGGQGQFGPGPGNGGGPVQAPQRPS